MPVQQTFYLNGPTLATATIVFLDANMTLCAPDGYYYDGTTARQQSGCVLLPAEACPECGEPCKDNIDELVSYEGVYYTTFDAGSTASNTGAIIIAINVDNSVNGIRVNFDGVLYNAVSSPIYGYLAGTPSTAFTYIGGNAYDCGIEGNTYTLDEYVYVAPSYDPLGTTTNITVTSGEVQLTATDPGVCIMVIPKPTTLPNTIDVTIVGPCPSSKAIIGISCPIKLPSFLGTFGVTEVFPEFFCNFPYTYTYYIAPVNGDGITLGLYDWVFSDENGANVLPDGFYRGLAVPAPFDTFEIQNGVVVAFHSYCSV
jgi:hypothetical protein